MSPSAAANHDMSLHVAHSLGQADLWPEAIAIYTAIRDADPTALTPAFCLDAAWLSLQAGDTDGCATFLAAAPAKEVETQILLRAVSADRGDNTTYHSLLAEGHQHTVHPIAVMCGLIVAMNRRDWGAAGPMARRALIMMPTNGTALTALAVEAALDGRYADAVAHVSHARADRFKAALDPAVVVADEVRRVRGRDQQMMLLARGAALDPVVLDGWDGWEQMLTDAVLGHEHDQPTPRTFRRSPRTAVAAARALTIGAARRVAERATAAISTPGPSSALDPLACSCHTRTVLAGPGVQHYLDEHLRPLQDAPTGMGYTALMCPLTARAFVVPDGADYAAILTPRQAENSPEAPAEVTGASTDLKVGQYL